MGQVQVMDLDSVIYSVIFWEKEGVAHHRTICYSAECEQNALDRYYTAGDFYHESFDSFEVRRPYMKKRVGA